MVGGTTFELLTPRGHGGVAVIAVHGVQRWQRVAELFQTTEGRPVRPTAGPQLVTMYLDGQAADQVLLVDRTAQACLEVHMHGSPAVVAGLEEAVGGWVESLPIDSRQRSSAFMLPSVSSHVMAGGNACRRSRCAATVSASME